MPRQTRVSAAFAASVLLFLIAAGCSNRLRDNPFDPGNPDTGGRPPGFVGIAGDSKVRLQWDFVVSGHLLGYELFRMLPGDTGFALVNPLIPADQTSYTDSALPTMRRTLSVALLCSRTGNAHLVGRARPGRRRSGWPTLLRGPRA
jgi:hypothetical protein